MKSMTSTTKLLLTGLGGALAGSAVTSNVLIKKLNEAQKNYEHMLDKNIDITLHGVDGPSKFSIKGKDSDVNLTMFGVQENCKKPKIQSFAFTNGSEESSYNSFKR